MVEALELVGRGGGREEEETMSEREGGDVERGGRGGGREGGEVWFDEGVDGNDVRGVGGGEEGGAVGTEDVERDGLEVSVALAGACFEPGVDDADGGDIVDEFMPGIQVFCSQ